MFHFNRQPYLVLTLLWFGCSMKWSVYEWPSVSLINDTLQPCVYHVFLKAELRCRLTGTDEKLCLIENGYIYYAFLLSLSFKI